MGSEELCESHFAAEIPILGLDLGKTSYKDLVFARGEFLSLVGTQNESLRLIITYYIKIHIWDHNNFARVLSDQKRLFNCSISAKLVIMTLFYRKVSF